MATSKSSARQIGTRFERLACKFLTAQGLQIITTNYNVALVGEIDVVALGQTSLGNKVFKTLVFVEVKARRRSQFASSLETVTLAKQRKIIKAAEHFIAQHDKFADCDCRFDVIGFDTKSDGNIDLNWIQAAFLVD
ncbi:YraN family protein [Moraxella nasovis]|uniref:YraN family protein n=1 Tax=Moraxella nasovis TaxID=2904121 RepID=UPI001F620769|nr:YraN family protein [Moraxella nasovis]UNU72675.1 YraN family protein [Moraxella nasovis]